MSRRRIWVTVSSIGLLALAVVAGVLGSARSASKQEGVLVASSAAEAVGAPASMGVGAGQSRSSGSVSPRVADRLAATSSASAIGTPTISTLVKSSRSFQGSLRDLPQTPPVRRERPEREGPEIETTGGSAAPIERPAFDAPAPSPIANFDGLDFATYGAGHPPDTNGDVGPTYYIQTVNTSIGIYNKSGGSPVAAFTFNTFMSQGVFGNLCDNANFGDPVVLYDTFEDRWIITDFAFQIDGSGNILNNQSFQCFAVSKSGNPVSGGWNFYSLRITDSLNDYPKFGIWPDGLYMSANEFGFGSISGSFLYVRVWSLNKAQMYAGAANPQVVSFDAPRVDPNGGSVFTDIPSNARLQAGTPPAGTPNYLVVTSTYTNALSIWKFHVDWNNVFNSTFTGPFLPIAGSSWANAPLTVPSMGGNALDTLANRSMMQNQYSKLGSAESLWVSHTVQGSSGTQSAVRWYQTDVTGGTVAAAPTQAATHNPDATNRFQPSLAVDRAGDMMIGYSASSSAMKPAIRYAGRLVGDGLSTLPQTEVDLIQGTGTQTGTCGGATCTRWGDYSAMTLDPDGCTFWYTTEYYAVDGLNDLTRIGSFKFPSCTAVGSGGTVSGTVTTSPGGTPISGATLAFGSRTTTTAVNGTYSFTSVPAGTYASISASAPGRNSGTSTPVVVTDGGTTTKDFALTAAPASGCLTDTSQADFSLGEPTKCDLAATPGAVILSNRNLDQLNASLGGVGFTLSTTVWSGQTFTPSVSGQLTRADINLFCNNGLCTGTPTLTLSVRATSGGVPTGGDLASTTIAGFSSGAAIFYTGTFSSPPTLATGTQYALIIRPTANPSSGAYAFTVTGDGVTGQDLYSGGSRVGSGDSGGSWTPSTTRDGGFRTYMTTPSGTFVSSLKDANPVPAGTVTWTTLSWNAATPVNTALSFQVAGSNNAAGPFNFVGPDSTAGTFFTTSGASLAQFNGLRYLKYKAYLSTTVPGVTPTLNDVSVCFQNGGPTSVSVSRFLAMRTKKAVAVSWRTRTEAQILGFNLLRNGKKLNRGLIAAKHSGQARGSTYRFVDRPAGRSAKYRLQVVDLNGRRSWYVAPAATAR
jgi:carboxypeptidase family protein